MISCLWEYGAVNVSVGSYQTQSTSVCESESLTWQQCRASGRKLCATILYYAVSYILSDMASSNCLAANTLLPPQWWALPCSICDINPFLSQRDSAWHADNGRFLGTQYWRALNKKRDLSLSLSPHCRSPRTPSSTMDQRQFVLGVFFFSNLFSFWFLPPTT